jgi:hypothetical protein
MTEIFDAVAAVATAGALIAAIWQLWVANRDRRDAEQSVRSDRAVKLFEEVVAGGDTAAAFHELSLYLRRLGSDGRAEVTWYLADDDDLHGDGVFSPAHAGSEAAFAKLYTVLWFFERVHGSLETKVIDADACFRTTGFHIWWWDQLLRGVTQPKARAALTDLARWVTAEAARRGELDNWVQRCATDFGGGGPIDPRSRPTGAPGIPAAAHEKDASHD